MLRLAANLFFCVMLLACPLICWSGQCCGGVTNEVTATSCCCDATGCEDEEHDGPCEDCGSTCLCKGAVLADVMVLDVEPHEAMWAGPTVQPFASCEAGTQSKSGPRLVDLSAETDCLTLRLQV